MKNNFKPVFKTLYYPIEKSKINGRGLFVFIGGDRPSTCSRFRFDNHDEYLHQQHVPSLLSNVISDISEDRYLSGLSPCGGGKIIIRKGMLYIEWLDFTEADQLMNDDFEKIRNNQTSEMFDY